jgi:diacylglycerol kinase family enzyme
MPAVESVMLIANPYAGTVSQWGKEVLVKALHADFKLEVADTTARDHATELARDAADRDFDAVLAFGGDGTVNEVAEGIVGTRTALGILPGGSTNVMARATGIPTNPVDATGYLARRLRAGSARRINIGKLTFPATGTTRHFLFAAGIGLDAEVVRRVERSPKPRPGRHDWLWVRHALQAAWTGYRGRDPLLSLSADGADAEKVMLAICCNGRPLTYFKNVPVEACPEARLDGGLDVIGLRRIRTATIPRVAWSLLVSHTHVRWRNTFYRHDAHTVDIDAERPLPVQVDGDYIGEHAKVHIELVHRGLDLLI